jgi:hypothetical protein
VESIAHLLIAATTDTSTLINRYLVDGLLVLILSAIWWNGKTTGEVKATLTSLQDQINDIKDDARDHLARSYGQAPRPRRRHRE